MPPHDVRVSAQTVCWPLSTQMKSAAQEGLQRGEPQPATMIVVAAVATIQARDARLTCMLLTSIISADHCTP